MKKINAITAILTGVICSVMMTASPVLAASEPELHIFPMSEDDVTVTEVSEEEALEDEGIGSEPAISAEGGEYVISDDCDEWELGMPSIEPNSVKSVQCSFKKTGKTTAVGRILVRGSANTTKIKSTVYLQKKEGSSYQNVPNGVSTKTETGTSLSHKPKFSVTATGTYRLKVMIEEYEGSAKYTRSPDYVAMDRNGY